MKILFVLGLEANPKIGGVERVTHVLSEYFIKEGIKVSFLYFRLKEISFPEYNKDVEVFFLPDVDKSNSKENITCLKNIIADNAIDIIINQGNIADSVSELIAASVKGTKTSIISILHNTPLRFRQFYGQYKQTLAEYLESHEKSLKNSIKKRALLPLAFKEYIYSYKKYFKIALQSSNRLVLLSKGYIPVLCKILKIKNSDKIIAIANPSSFNGEFLESQVHDKKKQVIYVGRLDYNQKRVDRLLEAWHLIENEHPDWQLFIIGGSLDSKASDTKDYQAKELARLQAISQKLELKHITFTGNTDPVPYYTDSSILCLTSNYEGFPMVLVEGIRYGVVPVVFGSFEAVYDFIEHKKNGMIATPFNITEYAGLLKELMQHETQREAMAVEAIRTSKKYTINVIGTLWIEIFNELVTYV